MGLIPGPEFYPRVALQVGGATLKVKLKLVGLDGNAFSLLGAFRSAAIEQGWKCEDVGRVLEDAMSGSYQHLLRVLSDNCEDPDDSCEDEDRDI